MDKRLNIIRTIIALAAIIALVAYTELTPASKPSEVKVDEQEDLEAVCAIVVMSVY